MLVQEPSLQCSDKHYLVGYFQQVQLKSAIFYLWPMLQVQTKELHEVQGFKVD